MNSFAIMGVLAYTCTHTTFASQVSLEELRAKVIAVRSEISTLQVTCSTQMQKSVPGAVVGATLEVSAASDGRCRVKTSELQTMNYGGEIAIRQNYMIVASDGKVTTTILPQSRSGSLENGTAPAAKSSSIDWFSMNLYNPIFSSQSDGMAKDLLHLLNSTNSRVRDAQEEVNDRMCDVIEVSSGPNAPASVIVWIDVERSCSVMRWQMLNNESIMLEYVGNLQVEVVPGIWFVATGTKHVTVDDLDVMSDVQLAQTPAKQWAIETNPVFEVEHFSPQMPSGFRFRDLDGAYRIQP